jgi:uncharacterized protein YjiS (DUF1127 family)
MPCGSTTCKSSASINSRQRAVRPWLVPNPFSLFVRLGRMHERWRQRQQLLELDEHLLDDIGLTRDQAVEMASRPFWK